MKKIAYRSTSAAHGTNDSAFVALPTNSIEKRPDEDKDNKDQLSDLSKLPPFLRLPGEIRNVIYRMVLVKPGEIDVLAATPPQHALLLTSRQVRNETAPIYYSENSFRLIIPEYKSDLLGKWYAWRKNAKETHDWKLKSTCHVPRVLSVQNWENILEWLQRSHAKMLGYRMVKPSGSSVRQPEIMLIGFMFQMVENMRDQSWTEVLRLLEEQHRVLITIDKRWERWPVERCKTRVRMFGQALNKRYE